MVIEFWSCEDARHAREKLIILSAIPEIMEKLGYDETEARRMLASVCPPEVAALAGDDWETNPLTLDLLKILREPNGNRKIMEPGLECGAAAYGVSVEETLLRICLLPDVSLEPSSNWRGLRGTEACRASSWCSPRRIVADIG